MPSSRRRAAKRLLRDATHPAAPPGPTLAADPDDAALILAALIVAISDDQLRPSSLRVFGSLAWQIRPGEVWMGSLDHISADLGFRDRTIRRVRRELIDRQHIARMRSRSHRRHGLILPVVEAALPPDRRATPDGRQLRLPLLVIVQAPLAVRASSRPPRPNLGRNRPPRPNLGRNPRPAC